MSLAPTAPTRISSTRAIAGRRSGSRGWTSRARTAAARSTSPIWVPYEQAEARVAAALAAGGRLVRDEFAPAWWTLADAAGNEADIATTMGRD